VLPTHKAVRELLTDRTGRSVTLAPAVFYGPGPGDRPTYAVYVDPRMRTGAVVVWDLTLSVLTGAALATIPVGGTETERQQRSLAPTTRHHLHDLLEEFAGLLTPPGGPPLHLYEMYPPGVAPPGDVSAYAGALGRRLDLKVTIAGYGTGRLSLVSLAG
jgi:hypothetical protein